jgi:high-affinity nickel-transport protein
MRIAMIRMMTGLCSDLPQASLRTRLTVVFSLLIFGNALAWGLAFASFHHEPVLLGTAFLAYVLGLRHAIDPDHIAAIDNVTRKLMQDGQQPVTTGLWFALGHSTIVVVAAGLLALTAAALQDQFEAFKSIGGLIGVSVSAGFLILIGFFNLTILIDVWRSFRKARRTGRIDEEDTNALLARRGFLARILRPLFGLISKPWHMYPLGFLFALGFDTATEISLFSIAATESARGFSPASIMIFPLLFTAGMALIDTLDGVLMLGAYQWATVQPRRKLVYNLVITALSVAVALFIGLLETLALFGAKLELTDGFWGVVAALNGWYGDLGFVIVALFAAVWLGAWLFYRSKRMALS